MDGRLKGAAIGPLIMLMVGAQVHALWLLARGAPALPWLGAALACGVVPNYLGYVIVARRPRTDADLRGPLLLVALGVALALVGSLHTPGIGLLPGAYAVLIGAGGSLLYTFWYSRFGREPSPLLAVGQPMPDVELEDVEGHPVRIAELRGTPTVYLFYRGNWCPLCMAQIRELAADYRRLAERGVKVALVSPQSHRHTQALAQRHAVPFLYLIDRELRAARALGIFHRGGVPLGINALGYELDSVLPTVVVTNAEGTIVLCDQTDNYRVRPEPESFLRALE